MFHCTDVYLENLNETADIVVNQGGTNSSKTYSILQVLFSIAISQKNKVITITGEDVPNLKRGGLRDALSIYNTSNQKEIELNGKVIENQFYNQLYSKVKSYNATDRIFTFYTGSIIEFVSFESEQDARNGKRDYLFINEAQGLSWAIAEQLINRTRIRTFIDYNPSFEFWPHEKLIHPGYFGNKKVRLIISDHTWNSFLSQADHDHIEKRYHEDREWGLVYARGKTGKIEGLIFRNYERHFIFPKDSTLIGYGLDFGFTNDPTALVEVRMQDGELFVKLLIYETGLTNQAISERMAGLGVERNYEIVADSAEPKSIMELHNLGWRMEGANKGKDSINNGIDILKRYKLNLIGSCTPLIKELGSYRWKEDKVTGKALNEPVDYNNHAIDAIRYLALNKLAHSNSGEYHIY